MSLSGGTVPHHVAVIPCRYGSTRFPGKPLALLGDKPLMWHVYQRCQQAERIVETFIATDDPRIQEECRRLDMACLLTGDHPTGTDRVAECLRYVKADGYINVQGDEPFVSPAAIDAVSHALALSDPPVAAVNACAPLREAAAVLDHNVVKVVTRADGGALMFSRQPIPYPRDSRPVYVRQLGLYGFTVAALERFRALPQGVLEQAEGVEMLRFLEHSMEVRVLLVEDDGMAVDTPEDLRRARLSLDAAPPADGSGWPKDVTSSAGIPRL
ncbi:3-deoxy-manno-octulosonate cytidylyltransferase [Streptosporangium sp. NPDC005286]|uniref:3-deoxy-manno-octulosonate cytidylyltransferase n=1 Tax=Streptosporangium sp. NPDC005286 TaxID=3154463 RepID=UPI0033A3CB25